MKTTLKFDKRDSAGIASILKGGEFASMVRDAAERIAANARGQTGADVVVDSYTTDRAAASVTIRDPRGVLLQVRDGVLTRAAAAAGLEVSG